MDRHQPYDSPHTYESSESIHHPQPHRTLSSFSSLAGAFPPRPPSPLPMPPRARAPTPIPDDEPYYPSYFRSNRPITPPPYEHSISLDEEPRSKRQQVSNACTNCQKACKRCAEQRPCPRCISKKIGDTCVNSTRKPREKGRKRGPYKRREVSLDLYGPTFAVAPQPAVTDPPAFSTDPAQQTQRATVEDLRRRQWAHIPTENLRDNHTTSTQDDLSQSSSSSNFSSPRTSPARNNSDDTLFTLCYPSRTSSGSDFTPIPVSRTPVTQYSSTAAQPVSAPGGLQNTAISSHSVQTIASMATDSTRSYRPNLNASHEAVVHQPLYSAPPIALHPTTRPAPVPASQYHAQKVSATNYTSYMRSPAAWIEHNSVKREPSSPPLPLSHGQFSSPESSSPTTPSDTSQPHFQRHTTSVIHRADGMTPTSSYVDSLSAYALGLDTTPGTYSARHHLQQQQRRPVILYDVDPFT